MTTSSEAFDIAIVGGGMVGLSLALLLANCRRDWRIALIESYPLQPGSNSSGASPNSFDVRSTALAEGSRGILACCGVWQHLADKLTPIRQVHVSDRGHLAGNLLDAKAFQYDALGYVVENPDFGQALLLALAGCPGITVYAPARVEKLQRLQSGWDLNLGTQHLGCNLLVLADGSASRLGQSLGIQYAVEDYGQSAIIANVETDKPHGGIAYERFTNKGPVALLPLGNSDSSCKSALVWTHPRNQVDTAMALDDEAFCRQLQTDFGHRAGRFCRVGSRHAYPLQLSLCREQIRAGLVMMGNAAHFLHPVAGQGFNLALRDCQSLVEVLEEASDPGELAVLQRYLNRQRQDQATTVGLSHGLVKLFSTSALPSALLRGLGLLALDAIEPAKKLFARQAMGFPLAGGE